MKKAVDGENKETGPESKGTKTEMNNGANIKGEKNA